MKNNFFVHETAIIDDNVRIGEKTKVWHFSHIQSGAKIGKNCSLGQNVNISNNVLIGNNVKIQNNVSVYEGVELQDYVFCGPSVVFTNIVVPRSEYPQKGTNYYKKTLVKKSASLGANATIICGNTIGEYSIVGAGTIVTKDIPDFALVVGNPGKIVSWVNKKGEKLKFDKYGKSNCGNYKYNGKRVLILEND